MNRIAHLTQRCFRRGYSNQESFLNGSSSQYLEDMYNAWLQDPKSVHISWDSFFRNSLKGGDAYHPPPNLSPSQVTISSFLDSFTPQLAGSPQEPAINEATIQEHLAVQSVVRSYQARGHLVAKVDPLMFSDSSTNVVGPALKVPKEIGRDYKLGSLDKMYKLPLTSFVGGQDQKLPLHEIIHRLEHAYCRHIGVEYMYIDNQHERDFIRQRVEPPGVTNLDPTTRRRTLKRLIRTAEFESFLSKKWTSEKRFGIEGCDMVIPALRHIIDQSSQLGVEHFFLGMSHRGRLNVLANCCRKPLYQIFSQFQPLEGDDFGSGDVKYHAGSYVKRPNHISKKTIHMSVLANPSHLEAVNAVVLGRTRAEQFYKGDSGGKHSMAITIHGDAAFSGQGVNYETFGLSNLPCYTTHGRICIIINNQIGFTTDPRFSRSSRYCTDLGRVVNAPIFHVNANDPDSVIHVSTIAAEWRAMFNKDIIIDLVGYRRHGHNEADEPMFTQPFMYTKIKSLAPVVTTYTKKLIEEKVVTQTDVDEMRNKYLSVCEKEYAKASQETQFYLSDWLDTPWTGFFEGKNNLKVAPTGVTEETLRHIATKFSSLPPPNLDFVVHKGVERMLKARADMVRERKIDWGLGEALAFGSLVKEGIHVRLSGEDVERGTFSHRHHVFHHQTVDKITYEPLSNLYPDQARYIVCNSSLSEYGVMGFEVGYAQANPNSLIMWEAQFGDFVNMAQCILDQFLASGQTKWMRQNGLVLLLPHGYDGMGPEHSSARIERFLQNSDDDPHLIQPLTPDFAMQQLNDCNWIVANCSTPANFFHILRRQVYLPFRKPLIIFTPKYLLRLPACRSSFDEMLEGTEFKRVIPEDGDASKNPNNVKKLMFCSGKVYYHIVDIRKSLKLESDIAVTRVEQYSPFPYDLVKAECEKYPNAKIAWAQEEPKNMGAYSYAVVRIDALLNKQRQVQYEGRPVAASPATGAKSQHLKELEDMEREFMSL